MQQNAINYSQDDHSSNHANMECLLCLLTTRAQLTVFRLFGYTRSPQS